MSVRKLLETKGRYVSVISSAAQMREAMRRLEIDEISALVVTDDSKNILGIVAERDVLRGLKQFGEKVLKKPVRELMSPCRVTCDINDPMSRVYELMDAHQVHYVPVLENGQLCGIVSILNVVRHRLDEVREEAEWLRHYISDCTVYSVPRWQNRRPSGLAA